MAKLHKATIRGHIKTQPGTKYNLYIDGVLSEKYEFDKTNSGWGYKDIRIEVLEGKVMIPEGAAEAEYPTYHEDPVWVYQKRYCEWMYTDEFKHDEWYSGTITYKHLWPQGPSYYKQEEPGGKIGKPVWTYEKVFNPMKYNKKETSAKLRELLGLS